MHKPNEPRRREVCGFGAKQPDAGLPSRNSLMSFWPWPIAIARNESNSPSPAGEHTEVVQGIKETELLGTLDEDGEYTMSAWTVSDEEVKVEVARRGGVMKTHI